MPETPEDYLFDIATELNPVAGDPPRVEVRLAHHAPLYFLADDPCVHARSQILSRRLERNRETVFHFESETRIITRLQIPMITGVTSFLEDGNKDPEVDLSWSPGYHVLKGEHAKFIDLRRILKEAETNKSRLTVAIDSLGVILDAKPYASDSVGTAGSDPDGVGLETPPALVTSTVQPAQAESLFAKLTGIECAANAPQSPCIPYRFVLDGCQTRASEITRIMIQEDGLNPAKNWVYKKSSNFVVATDNVKTCKVVWTWHCAPKLRVNAEGGTEWWVFDPSLFPEGPIVESKWLQTFPAGGFDVVTTEDPTVYTRYSNGVTVTDADYSLTASDLADLRDKLQEQACQDGPPPYDCSFAAVQDSRGDSFFAWLFRLVARLFRGSS